MASAIAQMIVAGTKAPENFWLGTQGGNNLIALAAILASASVAIFVYWRTEGRERRIEKSSAYMDLEVHSSEAFRYQAENARTMAPFRQVDRPERLPPKDHDAWETTLNYYFQCLNLFEVCSNFRRNRIIADQVFASWVAWFYDLLKDWYFRSIWETELRSNYTRDVRNFFDVGVAIFEQHSDQAERERAFYAAVAHLMDDCPTIRNWLDETGQVPVWPPARPQRYTWKWRARFPFRVRVPIIQYLPPAVSSRPDDGPAMPAEITPPPLIKLTWNASGDALAAAAFAASVIGQDTAYISHGEIQTGLSPDGRDWASNLAELYAADFVDLEDRDLLVVRLEDGTIAGVAIVAWEESKRRKFAVLEDMAVDPGLRSGGIGARIVEAVAERVRARGVSWLFLESGLRNERAHDFFKRHGFAEVSHVFARHLG